MPSATPDKFFGEKDFSYPTLIGIGFFAMAMLVALITAGTAYYASQTAVEAETDRFLQKEQQILSVAFNARWNSLSPVIDLAADEMALIMRGRHDNDAMEPRLYDIFDQSTVPVVDVILLYDAKTGSWRNFSPRLENLDDFKKRLATSSEPGNIWKTYVGHGRPPLTIRYQKAEIVAPDTGRILGYLIAGTVLNGNQRLLEELHGLSSASSLMLEANGTVIAASPAAPAKIRETSSAAQFTLPITPKRAPGPSVELISRFERTPLTNLNRSYLRILLLVSAVIVLTALLISLLAQKATRQSLKTVLEFASRITNEKEVSPFPPSPIREFNLLGRTIESTFRKLLQTRHRSETILEHAPILVFLQDEQGGMIYTNQVCSAFLAAADHAQRKKLETGAVQALQTGEAIETEITTGEGDDRKILSFLFFPIEDKTSADISICGIGHDITEARLSQEKLALSEQRFQNFAESASDWFWEMDADLRFSYISHNAEIITGKPASFFLGRRRDLTSFGDKNEDLVRTHLELLERHEPFRDFRYNMTGGDGSNLIVEISGVPVYDETGTFRGYRGIGRNITREAEIENQLRQSQKMQAIGQLTSGLAHDFNNLLSIISGNLELLREDEHLAAAQRRKIDTALEATIRGSALIQQLLAFARKQPLQPARVDIARIIRDIYDLLERSVGPEIELRLNLHNKWLARIDRRQMENALLNLVINARDAMPEGGTITISSEDVSAPTGQGSSNLPPGDYVCIAVRDTGQGMDADTAARAFDPFFTTKPPGQGSGLGLSMIHGFVHQSGGQAHIESTPGHGTVIYLYLPRAHEEKEEPVSSADVSMRRAANDG